MRVDFKATERIISINPLFPYFCLMDLIMVIFIALALSMDAFAVSMCIGTSAEHDKTSIALRAGVFFGFFQAIMPLIGWIAGYFMKEAIENIDHWIAFGLLFIIGFRMIYEAAKKKSCRNEFILNLDRFVKQKLFRFSNTERIEFAKSCKLVQPKYNIDSTWVMISLSVATSIDALAVGLSFALLQIPILLAVAIIGVITFGLSFAGVHIGKKLCGILGNKVEIAGGIVLIGIGIKILIEHLCIY